MRHTKIIKQGALLSSFLKGHGKPFHGERATLAFARVLFPRIVFRSLILENTPFAKAMCCSSATHNMYCQRTWSRHIRTRPQCHAHRALAPKSKTETKRKGCLGAPPNRYEKARGRATPAGPEKTTEWVSRARFLSSRVRSRNGSLTHRLFVLRRERFRA